MKILHTFIAFFIILLNFQILRAQCTYTCDCTYTSGTPACNGVLCIPSGTTLSIAASTTLNLSSSITALVIEDGGSITFGNSAKLNLAAGTELIICDRTNFEEVFPGNNSQADQILIGGSPYAGGQNGNGGGVCFSLNQVVAAGGTLRPTATLASITGTSESNPGCSNGVSLTAGLEGAFDQIVSVTWSSPGATFTPNGSTSLSTSGSFPTGSNPHLVTCNILVDVVPAGCNQTVSNVTVQAQVLVYVVAAPTATNTSPYTATSLVFQIPNGGVTTTNSISQSWTETSGSGDITSGGTTLTPTYTALATGGQTVILSMSAPGTSPCAPATTNVSIIFPAKLPITLQEFTGKSSNCSNELQWKVADAKNFKEFELEYSKTGSEFYTISSIQAKAETRNESLNQIYTYTDKYNKGKNQFYRLKMIDLDGSFKYSQVISVANECLTPTVSLYPNPLKKVNDLQLEVSNFGEKIQGKLIDLTGRTIQSFNLNNGINKVHIDPFAHGIYWFTLKDELNNEKVVKFSVIK